MHRHHPAWPCLRLLLLIAALTTRLPASSDPTPWHAGVATAVITPSEPLWMAGFGSRTKPSEGVRQDIFVRALALRDQERAVSVLITLDLVGVERQLADAITDGCQRRFGLPRDRVVLNLSHTHSGPVAGLSLMPLYDLSAEQRERVRRYTDDLITRILGTVERALQALAPARVTFGQGLAGIAVNRRRVRLRHLPGPVDHDVPVLAVHGPGNALQAIVVGYATHATALSDYLISGDWPGFAVAEIERRHPGATALFVQGCGADANPLPRRDEQLARAYGGILASAVDEVLGTRMTALSGPLRTAFSRVDVPFQDIPTRADLETRLTDRNVFVRLHARHLLATLDRGEPLPTSYPYPVQVWQFGRELTFIALGGEVVVDYSLRLKQRYGFDRTWVAGYSNDIPAYIPSRRVLAEGGYEGGDSMIYFGRPSRFAPAIEDLIVGEVARLATQVGAAPAPPVP
jgi:neutral ceramidase